MEMESIILNEIKQAYTVKYCMTLFTCGIKKNNNVLTGVLSKMITRG
jgi:hypothetical protein